jgi:hypothetical protein
VDDGLAFLSTQGIGEFFPGSLVFLESSLKEEKVVVV